MLLDNVVKQMSQEEIVNLANELTDAVEKNKFNMLCETGKLKYAHLIAMFLVPYKSERAAAYTHFIAVIIFLINIYLHPSIRRKLGKCIYNAIYRHFSLPHHFFYLRLVHLPIAVLRRRHHKYILAQANTYRII